jgi:septum formation protein
MKNIVYLGSKSLSRQKLLADSLIPFLLVSQDADEQVCSLDGSLEGLVTAIALQKMEHTIIPDTLEESFVLTADTMVKDSQGRIFGKPSDHDDAVTMIKSARNGMRLATAFCLEHRLGFVINRVVRVCVAEYVIDVPDCWIDWTIENSIGMQCAGGFAMEGIGLQFLKHLNGSFSNLMGLPLYELRNELFAMKFFN